MRRIFCILMITSMITVGFAQSNPYDVSTKPKPATKEVKTGFAAKMPYLRKIDWKPGMKFMPVLTDDSNLETGLSFYQTKFSDIKLRAKAFQGKIFTYTGLEVRDVPCPKGTCKRTYLIFDGGEKKMEHEIVGDTAQIRQEKEVGNVKGLVYLDEVDSVKSWLMGKTVYVLTNQWMQDDEKGIGTYSFSNPKFVQVTITNVGLGNEDGPSKVVFKPVGSDTEFYLDVRVSGINKGSGALGVDIDEVFQLKDPKLNYPKISGANWKLIQDGELKVGMTKQECELSWGKPDDVNTTSGATGTTEQWVYGDSFLYFEKGLLTTIQD